MKVTIIVCDNCGEQVEGEKDVTKLPPLEQEWCVTCLKGETVELLGVPFSRWPKRITRQTARELMEHRDRTISELKNELKDERKANGELARELGRVRRQAADAYSSQKRPVETLQDIATSARREAE